MKYVRVYDSLYEQEYIVSYKKHCEQVADLQDNGIDFEGCIIKSADTIEELCDEFVDIDNRDYYKISHKDGITFALSKTHRLLGNYDIRCKEIGQIMGSIYTDKGLIYVAKMNEKGELELL